MDYLDKKDQNVMNLQIAFSVYFDHFSNLNFKILCILH